MAVSYAECFWRKFTAGIPRGLLEVVQGAFKKIPAGDSGAISDISPTHPQTEKSRREG
jgi:hypothetical protein